MMARQEEVKGKYVAPRSHRDPSKEGAEEKGPQAEVRYKKGSQRFIDTRLRCKSHGEEDWQVCNGVRTSGARRTLSDI